MNRKGNKDAPYHWTEVVKTFHGIGSQVTDTFTVTGRARIMWEVHPGADDFYVHIRDVRKPKHFVGTFDGVKGGTTYLYLQGTFFFDVSCDKYISGDKWWTITIADESEWTPTTPTRSTECDHEPWASEGFLFCGDCGPVIPKAQRK